MFKLTESAQRTDSTTENFNLTLLDSNIMKIRTNDSDSKLEGTRACEYTSIACQRGGRLLQAGRDCDKKNPSRF